MVRKNIWMEDPVYNKLTSMHFYAWEKGLKTGIYYLRRKAKHQAQQFTIEPKKVTVTDGKITDGKITDGKITDGKKIPKIVVNLEEDEVCEMCSA